VIAFCFFAVMINTYFLVELILYFVAFGPRRSLVKNKSLIIELAL